MDKIEWSGKFSVGVEAIDEQHKTLIEMTNQLIDTPHIDSNSKIIHEMLDGMIKYATTHFVDEERLMSLHNYPDFEIHQKQHVEFMAKTEEFCFIEEGKVVVHDFSETILEYLRDWWVNHILVSDMKCKPWFTGEKKP
jgi:hemerythrin-like metal-binding protein